MHFKFNKSIEIPQTTPCYALVAEECVLFLYVRLVQPRPRSLPIWFNKILDYMFCPCDPIEFTMSKSDMRFVYAFFGMKPVWRAMVQRTKTRNIPSKKKLKTKCVPLNECSIHHYLSTLSRMYKHSDINSYFRSFDTGFFSSLPIVSFNLTEHFEFWCCCKMWRHIWEGGVVSAYFIFI